MNNNFCSTYAKISRRISLQLKSVCNERGCEIDSAKSAEIIHKLGLVYFQQNFDKVSLIKSVGLLNSSIVRNPKNILVVKHDLLKVCQFVLQQAKARNPKANLIQKAKEVKDEIESIRKKVSKRLPFLKTFQKLKKQNITAMAKFHQNAKIKLVKHIQQQITNDYKSIMKNLSQYCEHVMGPPPCKFAVVGMGFLARKEITPYSDFEHIILLENNIVDENCVEYFRWFSVIFHVIVLNLQETIIPSLNIEYLNDKTSEFGDWFFDTFKSGVSFDGMMVHACKFPLGRIQPTKNKPWTTELIKPVDEMLKYLSDDVNLKNGYHLSDILTETCFVYGNQALHNAFQNGIKCYKSCKTRGELLDEIRNQVKEDLDNFATRTKLVNLKPKGNLNVKQLFYRTSTLFITALGKICETKSSSSFEIINEVAKQHMISKNTKHKLSYAVAIACEIRLNVYMKAQSQRDYIQLHKNSKTIFDEILTTTDEESIVNYFQITYCLQREIIKYLRIKGSYIYSNPTLMNITICYALRLEAPMVTLIKGKPICLNSINSDSEQKNAAEKINIFTDFDKHLEVIENEMKNCASNMTSDSSDFFSVFNALTDAALNKEHESLEVKTELLARVVEILQGRSLIKEDLAKPINENDDMDIESENIKSFIGYITMFIAVLLIAVNKFDEALIKVNEAFECFTEENKKIEDVARFYFWAGNNWIALEKFEKSLTYLQIALGICLSIDLDQFENVNEGHIALMYAGIGTSLLKLDHYKESLVNLKIAVKMIEDYDMHELKKCIFFIGFASTFISLGKCLMQLGHFEDAMPCFLLAVEATESENANKESNIVLTQPTREAFLENQRLKFRASSFQNLGLLEMKQKDFKEAVLYLQRYLNVCKKLSDSSSIDETRLKLLQCYMNIYQQENTLILI